MKSQKGFAALEGLLILVIIAILGFTGWYVHKSSDKASQNLNNAVKANNQTAVAPVKTATPESVVESFNESIISGDKAKADALTTDYFKVQIKSEAQTESFYDACAAEAGCVDMFKQLESYKPTPKTTTYAAKDGTKGKTLTYTYTMKIESFGSQSSETTHIIYSLIPKGSSWMIDNLDANGDSTASADLAR